MINHFGRPFGVIALILTMFGGTACAVQQDQDSQNSQNPNGTAVWGTQAQPGGTGAVTSAYVSGPSSQPYSAYQGVTPQQREDLKRTMSQTAQQVGQATKDFKEFYSELQKAVQESGIVEEVNKMNLAGTGSAKSTVTATGAAGGFGAADVKVAENDMTVKVDLPGVDKRNLSVTLADASSVRIRVDRNASSDASAYRLAERYSGDFEKTIELPYKAKGQKFKADLRDGVLTIVIPKDQTTATGEIPIQIN